MPCTAHTLGISGGAQRRPLHAVVCAQQVLTPIFDPSFSASSFGFRPGCNAHQAIRQVRSYVKDGYPIAVNIDLAKFFDTVNHDLLMNLLGRSRTTKTRG